MTCGNCQEELDTTGVEFGGELKCSACGKINDLAYDTVVGLYVDEVKK